MVRQLHRGEFIDGADNVVLIGGPGTDKTHIARALGIQAVEHHGKKVRFFATVELVNALEQEKAMNKAGQLAECLLYRGWAFAQPRYTHHSYTSKLRHHRGR